MAIHIVLVEPEIPPNTGNIARTAAATDSVLHLVKPLGFSLDEKSLRRAGLDYWPYVRLEVHESLEEFLEKYDGSRSWMYGGNAFIHPAEEIIGPRYPRPDELEICEGLGYDNDKRPSFMDEYLSVAGNAGGGCYLCRSPIIV